MKFEHHSFSCDVDVFQCENDLVVRFYDRTKEHQADQIVDLVIVDPGYGYLCLKFKGDNALLSGFLDETIFAADDSIKAAIDYIHNLSPLSRRAYIPHHVKRFKTTGFIEYNGEY